MPDLPAISWQLNGKCVWWAPSTPAYNEQGKLVFQAGIEIACRWDDEITEFVSEDSDAPQKSKAVVMVDRPIRGGYLRNGPISEVPTLSDPIASKAWQVRGWEITPDIDHMETLYQVFL